MGALVMDQRTPWAAFLTLMVRTAEIRLDIQVVLSRRKDLALQAAATAVNVDSTRGLEKVRGAIRALEMTAGA